MAQPAASARRPWLTDIPVLLVAVVWGASYLAAREVATAATVLPVLVLRFGLVLPVLALVGWRRLRGLTGGQVRGALLLGQILGGIFLLETYGVVHTSATNAGLIISLTMIFTPAAESAVSRAPLPRPFFAAAGLSVLGVVLLTQGAGFTRPSAGDLLMLLAALARTLHVLVMARLRSVRDADAMSLTTVQLAGSLVLFAVLTAVPGIGAAPWRVAAGFNTAQWLELAFLSVCCTLFAFFVQMWAVRRTSPSRVSLLLGTEPLWAALVGVTLAGDRPGAVGYLGAVLVLAGTAWGRRVNSAGESRTGESGPGESRPGESGPGESRPGESGTESSPEAGTEPTPASAAVEPAQADGADPGLEPAGRP